MREQVTMKAENMRTDFLLREPATGRSIAVEVKNVVCTDHPPAAVQRRDAELRAQGVKKVRAFTSQEGGKHGVVSDVKLACSPLTLDVTLTIRNPTYPHHNQAKFPMYASDETPYVRAGIFPWGRLGQDFQGEKVVSERAIKHLHGLCSLASASASANDKDDDAGGKMRLTLNPLAQY